ncbi:MAG: nickel pincer cofactor biosynthesis protein LarB [Candidatus Glassbacteria bacterium]
MNRDQITKILRDVSRGEMKVEDAVRVFETFPFEEMGFAKVDHHRAMRKGFPEVIYCEGKTLGQITEIARKILGKNEELMATRADQSVYEAIEKIIPDAVFHEQARIVVVQKRERKKVGKIVILSAGTSDIPVAEEARVTSEVLGNRAQAIYDVGVAGIHRLLSHADAIMDARVIIVVAGMDGALASVVGGIVSCPVIAVPVSTGYGASFGGVAALLTMLNSCAVGVVVVNIDNGFGAGFAASLINRLPDECT